MKSFLFPSLVAIALSTGLAQAERMPTPSAPLLDSQKTTALEKAVTVLRRSVDFKKDGSATSYFLRQGRETRVEWRNLVFRQLILGSISTKDKEQGISRRIYAQITSDAYRLNDSGGFGPWRSGHCPGFPGFVVIEEKHGEFVASTGRLENFRIDPQMLRDGPIRPGSGDDQVVANNL